MPQAELINHFSNTDLGEVQTLINRWFSLPSFMHVSPEVEARSKKLDELVEPVKGFSNKNRLAVGKLLKEDDYLGAIRFMTRRIEGIDTQFSGDTATSAKISAFRRRGFVQEHLATFGELAQLPLGDRTRSLSFVSAVADYMRSDLEWGVIGDYAMRISECFAGAGHRQLQEDSLKKLFGQKVAIMDPSTTDAIMLMDMERRALDSLRMPSAPNSGPSKILLNIREPNTQNN